MVYRERLSEVPGINFRTEMPGVKHNYYNFVITVDQDEFGISRDDLYKKLKEYNIFTRRYFYPLCSQFQCYSKYPSSAPENLPVAERVSKSIMTLPLYGSLSKEDIHKISDIITLHAKRNARNFKVQSFCLPN